jgi:hypothetical protein
MTYCWLALSFCVYPKVSRGSLRLDHRPMVIGEVAWRVPRGQGVPRAVWCKVISQSINYQSTTFTENKEPTNGKVQTWKQSNAILASTWRSNFGASQRSAMALSIISTATRDSRDIYNREHKITVTTARQPKCYCAGRGRSSTAGLVSFPSERHSNLGIVARDTGARSLFANERCCPSTMYEVQCSSSVDHAAARAEW